MGDIRLNTPLCRVVRADYDDMEVQTINPDMVLWDRTRYRHKWPPVQDAPMLWMTFISWAGARRLGLIPLDFTYETWEADVIEIEILNAGEDDETGIPTLPGPAPG
jgi:hypothetical protein